MPGCAVRISSCRIPCNEGLIFEFLMNNIKPKSFLWRGDFYKYVIKICNYNDLRGKNLSRSVFLFVPLADHHRWEWERPHCGIHVQLWILVSLLPTVGMARTRWSAVKVLACSPQRVRLMLLPPLSELWSVPLAEPLCWEWDRPHRLLVVPSKKQVLRIRNHKS